MLEATNLGKRFGARWLFRHLEINLKPTECLAVTGENGSGKSTLLKCLAGLIPTTEGECKLPPHVGYAALDLALYPALSALEHLELAANLRQCEPRTHELLEFVGLDHVAGQYASEFSTGMKARLKLALAVQQSPMLLILDEPAAGLDERGKTLLAKVVSNQLVHGACVLATNDAFELQFATHRLEVKS